MKYFIILLLCIILSSSSQEDDIERKPLVDDLFTAAPSPHVFSGAIYIYPFHDEGEDEDEDVEENVTSTNML